MDLIAHTKKALPGIWCTKLAILARLALRRSSNGSDGLKPQSRGLRSFARLSGGDGAKTKLPSLACSPQPGSELAPPREMVSLTTSADLLGLKAALELQKDEDDSVPWRLVRAVIIYLIHRR